MCVLGKYFLLLSLLEYIFNLFRNNIYVTKDRALCQNCVCYTLTLERRYVQHTLEFE